MFLFYKNFIYYTNLIYFILSILSILSILYILSILSIFFTNWKGMRGGGEHFNQIEGEHNCLLLHAFAYTFDLLFYLIRHLHHIPHDQLINILLNLSLQHLV